MARRFSVRTPDGVDRIFTVGDGEYNGTPSSRYTYTDQVQRVIHTVQKLDKA
jgi:hypothetical protein